MTINPVSIGWLLSINDKGLTKLISTVVVVIVGMVWDGDVSTVHSDGNTMAVACYVYIHLFSPLHINAHIICTWLVLFWLIVGLVLFVVVDCDVVVCFVKAFTSYKYKYQVRVAVLVTGTLYSYKYQYFHASLVKNKSVEFKTH